MLKKAEIAAWPRLPVPKPGEADYSAAALQRDELLQVDVVGADGSFVRYACDGQNHIYMLCEEERVRWSTNQPSGAFGEFCSTPHITCRKEDIELCRCFLEEAGVSDWRLNCRDNVVELLDLFAAEKRQKERRRQWNAKWDLFREHYEMFPELPKDLGAWCEKKGVYTGRYLFIGKSQNGKRQATCSCCGKSFTITGGRHRQETECPRCRQRVTMIGEWYDLKLEEKEYVTVCYKVKEQLLIRTVLLYRWFDHGEKVYRLKNGDECLVLYLRDQKGVGKIYCYEYKLHGFDSKDWSRCRMNDPAAWIGWVYDRNLKKVFGERMYGVDPTALKNAKGPLRIVNLLDELSRNPVAEYLYKLGMYRLVSEGVEMGDTSGEKATFATVLGVNPQYKTMYSELDVNYREHVVIKNAKGFVHPEDLQQFRRLFGHTWYVGDVRSVFEHEPFVKCLHYIERQVERHGRAVNAARVTVWLRDYWQMCRQLRVDMSNKAVKWPRNLKEAHDRLAERIAAEERRRRTQAERERAEKLQKDFDRVVAEVYPRLRVPADKAYTIVMPECREDFLREGESLHHCVGGMGYFENHCKGARLICFVRKKSEPDKPFFTMELDVDDRKIRQLYGFKDCAAPKEVRTFAEKVVRSIRATKQESEEVA